MRKLLLALTLAVSSSAVAMSDQDFKQVVERLCSSPTIKCIPEYTVATVAGFTYEGNGHKEAFWISKRHWEKFERETGRDWLPRRHTVTAVSRPVGRPYIMSAAPYTRLDELETKKFRLQLMRGLCVGGFAGCSFAITKMVAFWPAFAATVTCATTAYTCDVIAENMIEKIDKEIEVIESSGHGSGGSSSGGASWVSGGNPHSLPPLPPLPTGTVTINDNPTGGSRPGSGDFIN